MNTYNKTAIACAFVLTSGCAAYGGGERDHDRDSETVVAGVYEVESSFQMPDELADSQSAPLAVFLDMTDDPNDPATWILDQVQSQLSFPVSSAFELARDGVGLDSAVNTLILESSPEIVTELLGIGNDVNQITRTVHLDSILSVDAAGSGYVADHEIAGVTFVIDGVAHSYSVAELGIPAAVASDLDVVAGDGALAIERHGITVPYGHLVRFAIDDLIVTELDPQATSLEHYLARRVGCDAIGQKVSDFVGVGSTATYAGACEDAIDELVDAMFSGITELSIELSIAGDAAVIDADGDGVSDELDGSWQGRINFGGVIAPLPQPAQTFTGYRVDSRGTPRQ